MAKGIVFNIQKFSIHDGPGVRTTVFLKGCPLRCAWCSNPESQLMNVQIAYDAANCVRCGKCVSACENGALLMDANGRIINDTQKCTACKNCVDACPHRCLSTEGEYRDVSDVLSVCLQDIDFYEESGGGVTISGGEGMVQPEFTAELVATLKEKGIHTAIETTGCVGTEVFRKLAPMFDLLLFDVKHYDTVKHKSGTAVGNERIIENLRWAHAQGIDVLPRIPVVPGFNGTVEDAKGIAALLRDIGLKRAQLLPFHQMGERKYEFLNREYLLAGQKALHTEDLEEYRKAFTDEGIDCFF